MEAKPIFILWHCIRIYKSNQDYQRLFHENTKTKKNELKRYTFYFLPLSAIKGGNLKECFNSFLENMSALSSVRFIGVHFVYADL